MKPGYLTTEFWITFLTQILNGLIQSGILGDGSTLVKAMSATSAVLTAVVYAITRAQLKQTHSTNELAAVGPGPDPQAGFTRLGVLLCLLAFTIIVGCTWSKNEAKHATADIVDCMAPKIAGHKSELLGVLDQALPALLSDTGKVDHAGFKALTHDLKSDAAGCAIAEAVSLLSKPRSQAAPLAAPLAVDVQDLEATWGELRREQFGGRSFALGDGS
jgi:hypothetical protein